MMLCMYDRVAQLVRVCAFYYVKVKVSSWSAVRVRPRSSLVFYQAQENIASCVVGSKLHGVKFFSKIYTTKHTRYIFSNVVCFPT